MTDLTEADVDAIRQYLGVVRDDVMNWLPAPWAPAWQSEAAAELANREARSDGAPWGEDPLRDAHAIAQAFICAAVDCLDALADSTNPLTTLYVPNVLARAAMEAGSQAWWLLESCIGPRRRVVRAVLIRHASALHLDDAARKLDPVNGTASAHGEDEAMVATYAKDLNLAPITASGRTWACETEILPGYTARAREFEKHVFSPAAYAIYSGAAHAELYSVTQAWRPLATTPKMLERNPDREVVWATTVTAAGFVTIPALTALALLGKRARGIDFQYHVRNLNRLIRQMDLPRRWTPLTD
jgi:hypothetical protein